MSALFEVPAEAEPTPVREVVKVTERDMLDRLNRRHSQTSQGTAPRWARAEHVKNALGFDARRVCDYMALDLWPGGYGHTRTGSALHGFEVKVSRADWLTELRDPEKALAFSRYCHFWWLAVSDASIVRDDLPEGWGLMVASGDSMRVKVQAPRREPEPMPLELVGTFSRAVAKTTLRMAMHRPEDKALRALASGIRTTDWWEPLAPVVLP